MHQELFESWMRLSLEQAHDAAHTHGELPIGGLIAAGDEVVELTQTSVVRHESIVAHGELIGLLDLKNRIWSLQRPVTLVTTLEPCAMCLGAAIQCGVDRIVFGMYCAPDGGLAAAAALADAGQAVPAITGPVLEEQCVETFRKWPQDADHPAYGYVAAILKGYGG